MTSRWRALAAVLAAAPLVGCGILGSEPEVLAEGELDGVPADVAAVDGAVWVAVVGDGGGLVKLDPDSLNEGILLPVLGGADAVGIGDDTVWALTAESGNVTAFDSSAGEDDEGNDFDIEIDSSDLVDEELFKHLDASGDVAYANGLLGLRRMTADGDVVAPPDPDADDDFGIDEEPDSELLYAELPMVITPSAVWAVTEDGLTRYDPDTLAPLDDRLGSDDVVALTADGDLVWSVSDEGVVERHEDGPDGEEIADLEGRFPDDENPEGIAYVDDELWLVGAGELVRLDSETGEELGDPLALPDGTEEGGYTVTGGPEDDTVVVIQRPTHKVWLVGPG